MRTLLIDNYDSYTYNLFHLFAAALGEEPHVVRNDEIPDDAGTGREFDGIVISPGPGRPDRRADFGGCLELIRTARLPLLGVCLGHQGIATAFGGTVEATEPVHGRATMVRHDGSPLFTGMPRAFSAMRYHSLAVAELPGELRATARDESGRLMALGHRNRPTFGVQFHPESVGTPLGHVLVENFLRIVREHRPKRSAMRRPTPAAATRPPCEAPPLRAEVEAVGRFSDPAAVFRGLFGADEFAYWIDRESAGPDGPCSAMGSASIPGSEVLTYRVGDGSVKLDRPAEGSTERLAGSIFDVLRGRLRERGHRGDPRFDFTGGYVGYLGYELKSELGSPGRHASTVPDARLIYTPRLLLLDHGSGTAYAVWTSRLGDAADVEATAWADGVREMLVELRDATPRSVRARPGPAWREDALDRDRYLRAITIAQDRIRAGESYEICLTNRITVDFADRLDPLDLYLALRAKSPAPYAAYLRFGDDALLSASPERFLKAEVDGRVSAEPMKGTRSRFGDPQDDEEAVEALRQDPKERAENMMIVDVLRNDLGRVCEPGSISVDALMEVRSFAQVHQLVSTVAGRLGADRDAIDCVESCFPGGSMTGAPKLRSMDIIDTVEPVARGPYAGALGWFGTCGALDLSIVIRTILLTDTRATVGSGGAVTDLSDPKAEYGEMQLKARALLETLDRERAARSPAR
jgi:para-aminobenzoate synthetase